MPQAFLGPNPGTTVKDVLEPELLGDGSGGTEDVNGGVTGDWVEVNFPAGGRQAAIAAVAELGTIAAGADLDIEVQGADDDSANGLVSFGRFAGIDGDDDDTERVLVCQPFKRYMRAVATDPGVAAQVRVVLRPKDYWQGTERTA